MLTPLRDQHEQNKLIKSRVDAGQVDIIMLRNISFADSLRAIRLCDLVDAHWFEGDHYQNM